MSAIGRALAYFPLLPLEIYDVEGLLKTMGSNHAPQVSRNSKATHGKRHASQKSRANRRKAGMNARARR